MATSIIPPFGGSAASWWDQNNPYRQRAKPVGTLVGSNPGGNPFSGDPTGVPGRTDTGPQISPGQYPGFGSDVWSQAMGVINPQLQNAADIINRRSQMGSGYISGLTNFLQQEMGGISGMVGDAYGGPIQLQKKVAGWSGDTLTSAGKAQTASVANQMKSAGPLPTSSDLNLTKQGAGAGGAAYGTGIAELDNLIAARAASQTRAALEPTFAAMTGQQQQSMLGAQLARQLADMQGNITAQIPQLLLDLQQRADTKAADQRDYEERVREFNAGRKDDRLTKLMQLKAANEESTGYQYVITSTGVKPKLVNGQKVPTNAVSTARRNQQISVLLASGLDPNTGKYDAGTIKKLKALGVDVGTGVGQSTVGSNISAATRLAQETSRYNQTMAKLKVAQQNATTAAQKNTIAQQRADEQHRHNVWVEQHPKAAGTDKPLGTPTGNRPRRSKNGIWTYANGNRITDPRIINWWENRYQGGLTDGRGGLGAVQRRNAAGGTSLPPGIRTKKKPGQS